IPYPNIAMANQAKGSTASKKVKIVNKKALTTKTEISMSSGNEAGSAGGGMISSKIKGPAKYKKGSSKVKVEGSPIVHLTSMIGQNGTANHNMPAGVQVAPSQTKVLVMP
ncbi:MAG: PAAR-like domain-containing protein, partial [Candidatus Aminicenantaceae bacterium]